MVRHLGDSQARERLNWSLSQSLRPSSLPRRGSRSGSHSSDCHSITTGSNLTWRSTGAPSDLVSLLGPPSNQTDSAPVKVWGRGSPLAQEGCTMAFYLPLALQMWEVTSPALCSLDLAKLEGEGTLCFHITCWISLTLTSEEMGRSGAGQIWGRRVLPPPHSAHLT